MRLLNFIFIAYVSISGSLQARNPVLLPLPQKYVRTNASFHPKEIAVSSEGKLRSILMEFPEELPVSVQPDSRYKIEISLVDKLDGVPLNSEEVPYLHIGADEVKFTNPRFVPEMVAYIRAKGKQVISWNPGWKYKPGEIDTVQLWSYRGKMQSGIPAIDPENEVLMKLPVGVFNTPEVRLVKWMFTFVCVTPDGENAVEGLVYSADKQLK